jgi:hypothetical protein
MANYCKTRYRGGHVRAPKLEDPQMAKIGQLMVDEQKRRWKKAVDADGMAAKKLSVKYFFLKRQYLGGGTPVRDNQITGLLVKNFTLRKATANQIRAENTSREARQHANQAQGYDQMIGFAISDMKVVFDATQQEYGNYVKTAWVPVGSTIGKP